MEKIYLMVPLVVMAASGCAVEQISPTMEMSQPDSANSDSQVLVTILKAVEHCSQLSTPEIIWMIPTREMWQIGYKSQLFKIIPNPDGSDVSEFIFDYDDYTIGYVRVKNAGTLTESYTFEYLTDDQLYTFVARVRCTGLPVSNRSGGSAQLDQPTFESIYAFSSIGGFVFVNFPIQNAYEPNPSFPRTERAGEA